MFRREKGDNAQLMRSITEDEIAAAAEGDYQRDEILNRLRYLNMTLGLPKDDDRYRSTIAAWAQTQAILFAAYTLRPNERWQLSAEYKPILFGLFYSEDEITNLCQLNPIQRKQYYEQEDKGYLAKYERNVAVPATWRPWVEGGRQGDYGGVGLWTPRHSRDLPLEVDEYFDDREPLVYFHASKPTFFRAQLGAWRFESWKFKRPGFDFTLGRVTERIRKKGYVLDAGRWTELDFSEQELKAAEERAALWHPRDKR